MSDVHVQLSAEDLTNDELNLLRAIHLWTRVGVVDASTGQRTKVSPVPWYLVCLTAATWRNERDVKVALSALRDDGLIEHGLHYLNGVFVLPDGKTIKVRHKVLGRERIAWSARIELPGGEPNLLSQMDIGTHPNSWILTAKGKKVLRDSPETTRGGGGPEGDTTTEVRRVTQIQAATKPTAIEAPPVDSETEAVILALRKHYPTLLDQTALAVDAKLSRHTVGERLRELEASGFVCRPRGERKGYLLTARGLDLYARLVT